jgi:CubicO group peptidase (beta-lactamase class C family)
MGLRRKVGVKRCLTRSVLILLLTAVGISFCFGQALTGRQVDSLAIKDLVAFKVPGLAIGIIKDGKLIYSKGFGVNSLISKEKTNSKTLFGIASNTKAFTAAALGILVDDGKLKWDDKVTRYIPEFKMYDAYATQEMTIRDLLVHRSGLATGAGDLMHDPDSTTFTIADIIYNLRFIKPAYSFRSKFAYDNNLYLVAGEVISRVSGMAWEDFVEKRILGPLQMDQSSASFNGIKNKENIIAPHRQINDSVRVITRYTSTKDDAAGGVYSNVDDLSKWLLMFMNNGKIGQKPEKQFLSTSVINELLAPQMIISGGNGGIYGSHFHAYGLGWFLLDSKGYKEIAHTGEDVGMVSEVLMIPEIGLGVIVLTNNESNAISAIADQIVDSYLNITGVDESKRSLERLSNSELADKTAKKAVWAAVNEQYKNTLGELQTFAGTYRNVWFGDITIQNRQGLLYFASRRSPQLRGLLHHYKKGCYVIKWENPEVDADTFITFAQKKGSNTTFKLQSASPGGGFNYDGMDFKKN